MSAQINNKCGEVPQAIQNVRDQFPQVGIMHYVDDIFLAHKNERVLPATCG